MRKFGIHKTFFRFWFMDPDYLNIFRHSFYKLNDFFQLLSGFVSPDFYIY